MLSHDSSRKNTPDNRPNEISREIVHQIAVLCAKDLHLKDGETDTDSWVELRGTVVGYRVEASEGQRHGEGLDGDALLGGRQHCLESQVDSDKDE